MSEEIEAVDTGEVHCTEPDTPAYPSEPAETHTYVVEMENGAEHEVQVDGSGSMAEAMAEALHPEDGSAVNNWQTDGPFK